MRVESIELRGRERRWEEELTVRNMSFNCSDGLFHLATALRKYPNAEEIPFGFA